MTSSTQTLHFCVYITYPLKHQPFINNKKDQTKYTKKNTYLTQLKDGKYEFLMLEITEYFPNN